MKTDAPWQFHSMNPEGRASIVALDGKGIFSPGPNLNRVRIPQPWTRVLISGASLEGNPGGGAVFQALAGRPVAGRR